jgi:hypothetical protein
VIAVVVPAFNEADRLRALLPRRGAERAELRPDAISHLRLCMLGRWLARDFRFRACPSPVHLGSRATAHARVNLRRSQRVSYAAMRGNQESGDH